MPIVIPDEGASNMFFSMIVPSSPSNLIVNFPAPGKRKSVALYWSPYACRPTTIGRVHPGTKLGTF